MRYNVIVYSNFNRKDYESNSRNSIQHLRDNGGFLCIVTNKNHEIVSAAAYSEGEGYYHLDIDALNPELYKDAE